MIDWFISKIGLLLFVTACAAVLISFFLVFSQNFQLQNAAATATDIAYFIDLVQEGDYITYSVYLSDSVIAAYNTTLIVNGIERNFISTVQQSLLIAIDKLLITKIEGVVYVVQA